MGAIEFKKEYIDIADLLRSTIALGPYRGLEVWTKIETLMDGVSDDTLVLIDLRRVNWFHTAFCEPAFGPIFRALTNHRWSRKYVIFQMHDFHKWGFFQGVLKFLGIDVPRRESESEFVSANMYAKLIIGDKESIDFIGSLNASEKKILDVVNDLKQATAKQIEDESGLAPEIVVDTLRALVREYFIVEYSDESNQKIYYSFYNYLPEEKIQ